WLDFASRFGEDKDFRLLINPSLTEIGSPKFQEDQSILMGRLAEFSCIGSGS
nr:hypothetical protein [Tanacetum cinerariifolium]